MKKNVISSILAATMVLSLSVPAFAAEPMPTEAQIQAEIEARQEEIFADVYAQLEEQGALDMMDIYINILAPDIEAQVRSQYGTVATVSARATKTYNAPNGAALSYEQTGLVKVTDTYLNKARTTDLINEKEAKIDFGKFLRDKVGSVPAIGSYASMAGWAVIIVNTIPKDAIQDCGGYARVVTTDDPASGARSNVVLAWKTYPTINLDTTGIKNIEAEIW